MVKRVLLYLGLSVLLVGSSTALAMEPDARSYAMGGAYTAVVDDASAVYWNPAKLPDIKITSIAVSGGVGSEDIDKALDAYEQIMSNEPPTQIEANGTGAALAALSTRWIGVGVYGNFDLDVEADSQIDYELGTGEITTVAAGSARVNGVLAAAKPFKLFNLGVAVKAVGDGRYEDARIETLEGEDQVTAQIYGTGYSADVALATSLTPMIQLGIVAQDVVSSIEYEKTIEGAAPTTYTDSLEPAFRAGIALKPGLGFTLAGDITDKGTVHLGLEKNTFFNGLSVRAGMVTEDGETEYRAGLGLNLVWLHLDLGVGMSSEEETPTGVMLNASLTF